MMVVLERFDRRRDLRRQLPVRVDVRVEVRPPGLRVDRLPEQPHDEAYARTAGPRPERPYGPEADLRLLPEVDVLRLLLDAGVGQRDREAFAACLRTESGDAVAIDVDAACPHRQPEPRGPDPVRLAVVEPLVRRLPGRVRGVAVTVTRVGAHLGLDLRLCTVEEFLLAHLSELAQQRLRGLLACARG